MATVVCALWTRRPIVNVAMGCYTEPVAVHIAHVLQNLHFFQLFNFFDNLHDLPQKKFTRSYRKFFFIIYTTYRKKFLHAFTAKEITRFDDFFVQNIHFSRPPPTRESRALNAQMSLRNRGGDPTRS